MVYRLWKHNKLESYNDFVQKNRFPYVCFKFKMHEILRSSVLWLALDSMFSCYDFENKKWRNVYTIKYKTHLETEAERATTSERWCVPLLRKYFFHNKSAVWGFNVPYPVRMFTLGDMLIVCFLEYWLISAIAWMCGVPKEYPHLYQWMDVRRMQTKQEQQR